MLRWLGYLWPWPLTLNFQGQVISREWEGGNPWSMVDLWVWENFWHPSRWPWVKVTKLPKRDAIYLVFTIKLIRTAHPIATKLSRYIPLIMLATWLNFGEILPIIFLRNFSWNFKSIFPSRTLYLPYLRNGWSNWCEIKRKWVNWILRWLGYLWPWLWPWIFNVKFYLGNGRLDCHGMKGTAVDRMPWCETLRKWVNWMLHCLGYLWPWIFKVKSYLGNERPDCHGMKGTGVDRMPWCETLRKWVNWMLHCLGYLWPWIFKVKLYLGNGRPDCHGMEGTGGDSMPWCKTQPLCDPEAEDIVTDGVT